MPCIKDKSTVEAIAREFTSNGRNKLEALKTIGYEPSYYNTRGIGVVYSNVRIIAAIAEIDAKQAEKAERTISELDQMYQHAYNLAEKRLDPNTNSMNGSITGIARLYGMDKDAGSGKEGLVINVTSDRKAIDSKEIENEV